jgi:putative RecB family exonuclease
MALEVPTSLSPSRVEAFTSCPQAFRFASIDKVPEPPMIHMSRGTLVHRALELLHTEPPERRTVEVALTALDRAYTELAPTADFADLYLSADQEHTLLDEAEVLVRRSFELEDPRLVRSIGLELKLEARVGSLTLRGIIDRLDLDDNGELVVTDYKTGRPPSVKYEQSRLNGVQFYAFLCEQNFGRRPSRVQLLYLSEPVAIITAPSEQQVRFLPKRVNAVWQAVERACERDDFRPRPGPLCESCFYRVWCPAFGGDPALAATEAPLVLAARAPTAAA